MSTEIDSCCPICLDSWKEISYILPCLHQFCYTCILQWAEKTPKCPLCKRRILSILHSVGAENDYMEHVIALSETSSIIVRQARGDPRHLDLHFSGAPQTWAAEGVPRHPVGSLQPGEWMVLFRDHPCLLDTLVLWVRPRLRQIFRNNWTEADLVEDAVMDILTNHGIDEDQLIQMLWVSLQNLAATFVQQLVRVAVRRCSREACRLLAHQPCLPAQVPALLTALQDAQWMRCPTPPPLPWMGIPEATPLYPLPSLLEQEEPHEEPEESDPASSTSRQSSEALLRGRGDP
ncbi:PREDICTED: uncharacterized protein LOC101822224 [Ficedula albicollis]|uniref:uncharacterized protein LOC101822224 n=1 Tax=Ficedula albicollis TaxID=59894 RepID=UPI0003597767|nr:PREDICTED: uncharacterized protein LOC101822224 [Ficedula albicollis]XP_005061037.1 PREDICTED: uncharacterized protein LOC101822224 [Ficedula albicollis]XP_016160133.1 PREDICTED: uncharacterized protein LOC101822224 [Ficedula albicollis]XP_016160134.1 PREDICTED: uncharacterized protein LOC101822224 [Ficedula albicollis]